MDINEDVKTIRVKKFFKDNKRRFKIDEDAKLNIKTLALTVGSIAVLCSIIITPVVVGANVSEKKYEENVNAVNYYEEQKFLGAKYQYSNYPDFYFDFEKKDKIVEKLPDYIECARKINELGLDRYEDIEYFNDSVVEISTDRTLEKVEEFKALSKEINNRVIGDDVVKLNHLAYELKELEKIYNKKIFEGYDYLEQYGLASVKSYLADRYGGDPSKYEIQFHDYHHNGGTEITGPGIPYGDRVDSEFYEYCDNIRKVYKAENASFSPNPEEYNKDRNSIILDTIKKYNIEGADIISDIERQNKKK